MSLSNTEAVVSKQSYVGLFLVTLATLMYEILLTRIFSVTMWYHFAFIAVSVAMFGMTLGAILVYLFPDYFTQEKAKYHLALSSYLFTITIVFSLLTHLCLPFVSYGPSFSPIVGIYSIALTYVVIAIPFIFSGICVCLALTKFPRQISKLYAADLAGAALGCVLLIFAIQITDGPTVGIIIAGIAGIGTMFFATEEKNKKLMRITIVTTCLLFLFAFANTVTPDGQVPLLRLMWVKTARLSFPPLYEKWNSFSRITVEGDPDKPSRPLSWGISKTYPEDRKFRQLMLTQDETAGTVLTAFNGDLKDVDFLKYEISNLVHYVRPDSKVLIVGPGGGRDVLSALVFNQKSILGVELNKYVLDAANRKFGDFTGHLDKHPKVTFVHDEARSYVARQKEKYDIIQVSLIDTWAATTAGALVMAENTLYTVEGWKIFLEHLAPRGVMTFSRWYYRDLPGEMYRLTSLASASLTQLGIENPRDHIMIVKCMNWNEADGPDGVGTMLVSMEPFSDQDMDIIEKISREMEFDLVLNSRYSIDSTFAAISSGKDLDKFTEEFPINIAPTTDDNPFFFFMLRFRDMFNRDLWNQGIESIHMKAVFFLGILLVVVLGLTFLCIIVPLLLTTKKESLKGSFPLFIFFAAIGLGFMFVEISQMERLIIFLGHPVYGLSVVLFSLLLSSGIGSYSTQKINYPDNIGAAITRIIILLCVIFGFGVLTPYTVKLFQASTTIVRILVSIAILFPLGMFMGMPFPLGLKLASNLSDHLTPWLWGINGAMSVCASVLAVVMAISVGVTATFWLGFSCYLVALPAFVWASSKKT